MSRECGNEVFKFEGTNLQNLEETSNRSNHENIEEADKQRSEFDCPAEDSSSSSSGHIEKNHLSEKPSTSFLSEKPSNCSNGQSFDNVDTAEIISGCQNTHQAHDNRINSRQQQSIQNKNQPQLHDLQEEEFLHDLQEAESNTDPQKEGCAPSNSSVSNPSAADPSVSNSLVLPNSRAIQTICDNQPKPVEAAKPPISLTELNVNVAPLISSNPIITPSIINTATSTYASTLINAACTSTPLLLQTASTPTNTTATPNQCVKANPPPLQQQQLCCSTANSPLLCCSTPKHSTPKPQSPRSSSAGTSSPLNFTWPSSGKSNLSEDKASAARAIAAAHQTITECFGLDSTIDPIPATTTAAKPPLQPQSSFISPYSSPTQQQQQQIMRSDADGSGASAGLHSSQPLPTAILPTAVIPTAAKPTAILPAAILPAVVIPTAVVPAAILPTTAKPNAGEVKNKTHMPNKVNNAEEVQSETITGAAVESNRECCRNETTGNDNGDKQHDSDDKKHDNGDKQHDSDDKKHDYGDKQHDNEDKQHDSEDKQNVPPELIRFKNLDTGDVRYMPLELVEEASAATSNAKIAMIGAKRPQGSDAFFDIFDVNSETYLKLQKRVDDLAERRRKRAEKARSGVNYLEESDDEMSDDGNGTSGDDEDSAGLQSGVSTQTNVGFWGSRRGSIKAFLKKLNPVAGAATPGGVGTCNAESAAPQNSQGSIDSSTEVLQSAAQQQQPSSRLSRFLHRRQQPVTNNNSTLPVVATPTSVDESGTNRSAAAALTASRSSTSGDGFTPSGVDKNSASSTTAAGSKFQAPSWFRRGSGSSSKRIPYKVPTRIVSNKEQHSFNHLWLIKEMKTPDQTVPIWSLAISGDGRWIAAGVQSGAIHLWRVHDTPATSKADLEVVNSPLMSTYETVDLSTPRKDQSKNNNQQQSHSNDTSPVSVDGSYYQRSDAPDAKTCSSRLTSHEPNLIFSDGPDVTLTGHTATIVVCRWDFKPLPNGVNRLASASLDRSVRVWSIESNSNSETGDNKRRHQSIVCYCADWCTGVCFHPSHRDLLYTSALDGTVQVWRIPLQQLIPKDNHHHSSKNVGESGRDGGHADPSVPHQWIPTSSSPLTSTSHPRARRVEMLEFTRMSELVTAMSMSPDGSLLAVGLRFGRVAFYESRTLRFRAEVECRNRKGRYAKGRKVTGLVWASDSQSICVSTSDSRIRVIILSDVSNWLKFKGHVTNQMMLYAQYTPSEQHLVCGSESSWVFLWNLDPPSMSNPLVASRLTSGKKKKLTNDQVEKFKAFDELLTSCLAAPEAFSSRVIDAITNLQQNSNNNNDAPKQQGWDNLLEGLSSTTPPTTTHGSLSLNHLVIVAGSVKGTIRVFLNVGHPVPVHS